MLSQMGHNSRTRADTSLDIAGKCMYEVTVTTPRKTAVMSC